MRYLKIAPKVANVTCKRKTLDDKNAVYPADMWPEGVVEELIARGFLIEVEGTEAKISNPADAVVSKVGKTKVLSKADIKADPSLKDQGLKPGDTIDIPDDTPTDQTSSAQEEEK